MRLNVLVCLVLVACGGRAGPGSGPADGAAPGDASACPSPAPTEGVTCTFPGTQVCEYALPGPCPGAVENCRCMNGSWSCQVSMLDGGPCGSPADAAPDASPLAFCTGTSNHLVVNGNDSSTAWIGGTILPLNCCDAAEFVVVTQTVPATLVPIVVMWRAQVGQATLPATIDLANPPAGWTITVDVGCDPAQGGCNPAPDSYTTGLTGMLQVSRTSNGGYDMSLCLSVTEPAGSPHPLVHSLELWAPHVMGAY